MRNRAIDRTPDAKPDKPARAKPRPEGEPGGQERRRPKPGSEAASATRAHSGSGDKPRGGPRSGDKPAVPRPPRDERRSHFVDRKKPRPAAPPKPNQYTFFVPCPRGLEDELAKELGEIGIGSAQAGPGGASFEGGLVDAWRVNLWSRLGIRVLWRLKTGAYTLEDDLYEAAMSIDWPEYFSVDQTIAVTTVARSSPLKSLNFVSLKVKDAVCDRFREVGDSRPSVDAREPKAPILLYLNKDQYSLYIDLTGDPLNRRGYRVEPAPAPLNENLAAGLLRLSGWTPETPLLDPMMGGGTILLEAGLMALNRAPGLKRHFAFENLKSFDKVEWARLRKDAQAAALEPKPLPIYGCDIDPAMVRATGLNLRAAGLLDCIAIDEGDALEIPAPEDHGVLISNPPYGVRLGVEDMAALYDGLGDTLKQHFTGWRAYLLSADPELPKQIGLKATRRVPLYNGPLECRLYEYKLVAGSNRKD
ncbi:MAG: class I SAM-dependent RNA methyltransferase [Hydrogenophilales bacterium]|nr:class I SAM-dependent RNA methyltransferase [Hydrogenophilales bacterium]